MITRFGWWSSWSTGNPAKAGQFQGLAPFPFVDVDTLLSDGRTTADFWGSVLNPGSYDFASNFYRDGIRAAINWEEFPYRFPIYPPIGGTRDSNNPVVSQDLNVGQDYAVQVQQLKANFSGPLTEHLSWRVNVFAFHKYGQQQANSTAHCFNVDLVGGTPNNHCHAVSQSQQIDWLTTQVEPGIVGKFDWFTVDYSWTLRSFTANDQTVYAPYTNFPGFGGGNSLAIYPYSLVPNSSFQMQRIKIGMDFTKTFRLYSYLYNGMMSNLSRDTNRAFGGFDIRLINSSPSGITTTAYAKLNQQNNQYPPYLLPEETANPQLWHPVNYYRFWTGLDGQWFPFRNSGPMWQGLSFRANYEFNEISRQYASYPTNISSSYVIPPTLTNQVITTPYFTQPNTDSHSLILEQRMRWLDTGVITFARYQMQLLQNPLYAVTQGSGALNSNQPTDNQSFVLGGSWSPLTNLMLSARVEFQRSWLSSPFTSFSQTNYPFLFTLWYAPTEKLSLSAGYSFFSNWINQDMNFGYRGLDEPPPPAETLRVGYSGQTQVVNVGARYSWSQRLLLTGGVFWVDGFNVWNVPASQTGANWSMMPLYSDVRAQSIRVQAGFDYHFTPRLSSYFRVNTSEYLDHSQTNATGNVFSFLGGVSGVF